MKRKGFAVSLDPLMNIAVCLVGALIFVIIATGAATSRTNVVIPTPIEERGTKRTIIIECRDNQLFLVPVEELHSLARHAAALHRERATNETYEADVAGHIAAGGRTLSITAIPGVRGYPLPDYTREPADGWYATLLSRMNQPGESIFFLVRDDSFRVFKNARILAWQTGAEVSFELLSPTDRITFPVVANN